jgi:hypothetical protein
MVSEEGHENDFSTLFFLLTIILSVPEATVCSGAVENASVRNAQIQWQQVFP